VAVRPEFGPTLPALVRDRGIVGRALAGGVLVVAAIVVAALVIRAHRGTREAVVRSPFTFNVVYNTSELRRVAPHRGDLLRLEGARRGLNVVVAVRAVALPAYAGGDAVAGLVPVVADRRERELAALYGPLMIFDEGRITTNTAPGYQIGFRAGRAGDLLFGRDLYVFPQELAPRVGALVSLRQFEHRRVTAAGAALLQAAREAFRSFTFGDTPS
jgi:hypothetical protein